MGLVQVEFSAPWSRSVRLLTAVAVTVLASVTLASLLITPRLPLPVRVALVGAPLLVLLLAPEGMRGSLRLLGNGGLFAICGWFWNRRIGRYRAYATDPERAVLLRYRDGTKVVLTPHDVQHFIVRVRRLAAVN